MHDVRPIYVLGSESDYPYTEVFYEPDNAEKRISIQAGSPMEVGGVELTARAAMNNKWRRDLARADADWFTPFLERMSDGEDIPLKEIARAHKKAKGFPLMTVQEYRNRGHNEDMKENERNIAVRVLQLIAGLVFVFGLLWYFDDRDPFYPKACIVMSLCLIGLFGVFRLLRSMVGVIIKRRDTLASQFVSLSDDELLDILNDESDQDIIRKQAAIHTATSRLDSSSELHRVVLALQSHKNVAIRSSAMKAISMLENEES